MFRNVNANVLPGKNRLVKSCRFKYRVEYNNAGGLIVNAATASAASEELSGLANFHEGNAPSIL
jgi:hypothetical protein